MKRPHLKRRVIITRFQDLAMEGKFGTEYNVNTTTTKAKMTMTMMRDNLALTYSNVLIVRVIYAIALLYKVPIVKMSSVLMRVQSSSCYNYCITFLSECVRHT